MRVRALIVLVAILVSIFAPVSITIQTVPDGTYLITLDICNANTGGHLTASDGVYIPFHPFQICKLCVISFIEPENTCFRIPLLPATLEHPPEV